MIVDWEYAGMGDPFFDLANFSINHEARRRGPARCSSPPTPGDAHAPPGSLHFDLMRFMSDFREAM